MRTSIFLGTALSVLLASGVASATKTTYQTTMNGLNERPNPVVTAATGTATLTFDDANNKLCGSVTYQNLSGTATLAHIHEGGPNATGGPVVTFTVAPATIKVNMTLAGDAVTDFKDFGNHPLYVNVHTGNNPNGEIRGNLAVGGTEQSCDEPDAGADGGTDGGADGGSSGSSGSSGASSGSSGNTSSGSSGNTSSGGSNGAVTTPADGGTTPSTSSSSGEDDGCSTTGSSPAENGLAIGLGAMVAIGFIARARRRTKR